jgi:hypothetical protein
MCQFRMPDCTSSSTTRWICVETHAWSVSIVMERFSLTGALPELRTGVVIPAHAGIQSIENWIPASAGMTSNPKIMI